MSGGILVRALFLVVLLAVGAAFVAPNWEPEQKTLTLRIRTGDEIEEAVRGAARRLGAEVLDLAESGEEPGEKSATPSVGAGPPPLPASPSGPSDEVLHPGDADRLDELVEEALREE